MMPQPSQRALAAYICRATGLLRFGWPVFRHLTHTIASFQLSSLAKEIFTRALKIGLGPLRSLRVINFRWDHCRQRSCTCSTIPASYCSRSEEHTSELQSRLHLVCRLLLEKKKKLEYPLLLYCESAI